MNQRVSKFFAAAALIAAPAFVAADSTVYDTSFEASGDPSGVSFSIGDLNGQGSWTVDAGTAEVTNASISGGVPDGTQYVSQGVNSSISRSLSTASADDRVIMVSQYNGSGSATLETPSDSTPMAVVLGFQSVSGGIQLAAWDGVDNAYVTGATVDADTWHEIIVSINYTTKIYDVMVNGTPYLQEVNFHDSSVTGLSGFQSSSENSSAIDGVQFFTSDGDFDNDGVPDDEEVRQPGGDPTDDTKTPGVRGDVSGDGTVTPLDSQDAFDCYLLGDCVGGKSASNADIAPDNGDGCVGAGDGDGSITPSDAQRILELYLGSVSPCS